MLNQPVVASLLSGVSAPAHRVAASKLAREAHPDTLWAVTFFIFTIKKLQAMALIVQEIRRHVGGHPDRIKNVARRVAKWRAQGRQVVVVVSAMSGETNRLIAMAREIQANPIRANLT